MLLSVDGIKFGAFNIKQLGPTKMENKAVVNELVEVGD